ncbi:MAG: hypothetical protein F6K09_01870 [Merismopedia sp. SIO2A8]|nr:hypothetical protein [Merismopedia sp. SIO2A8]
MLLSSAVGYHLGVIPRRTMALTLSVVERQTILSWLEKFTIASANPTLAVNKLLCGLGWGVELVGDYLHPLYGVYSLHELTDEQLLDLWMRLSQSVADIVINECVCETDTEEMGVKDSFPFSIKGDEDIPW